MVNTKKYKLPQKLLKPAAVKKILIINMVACVCAFISSGDLEQEIKKCNGDMDHIVNNLGAGSYCGRCLDYIEDLCETIAEESIEPVSE